MEDATREKVEHEMYRTWFNEGKRHASPSPETKIMIDEWKTFKRWSIGLVLTMLSLIGAGGIWVGSIQVTQGYVSAGMNENKDAIVELRSQQESTAQVLAGIASDVKNTRENVAEIKSAVHNIK